MKDINENSPVKSIGFFTWFAKSRGMQVVFFLLLVIVPLAIFVYAVLIPVSIYKPSFVSVAKTDTTQSTTSKFPSEQNALLYTIIEKEKALLFEQNRLELAQKDSIYLLLNLPDSSITIEIKGLPIRVCKILSFSATKKLVTAQHDDLKNWLIDPFTVANELATIPKTPFIIVDAPKDTVEAAQLPKKAVEPEKTVVQYTLWFDRNFVLEVKQSEEIEPEQFEIARQYQIKYDSVFRRNIIQKMIQPMPSNQPYHIKIVLSAADARTIYRAIPHSNSANLVLKL